MCVMSMVMDQYRPYIPDPYRPKTIPPTQPTTVPVTTTWPQPGISVAEIKELRELIDSFRKMVEGAAAFDRLTGQPDCVDPEKAKLEERVEELERRLDELQPEG